MNDEIDTVTFYKDKRGKWRWRKVAANGEIVSSSTQGYAERKDCEDNFVREVLTGYKIIEGDTP